MSGLSSLGGSGNWSGDWAMLVQNELQSSRLDRPGKEGRGSQARALLREPGTMSVGSISEVCVHTTPSYCLVFADFLGHMLCSQGHIN